MNDGKEMDEAKAILTLDETADFLRVSRGLVYAAAAANELPGGFTLRGRRLVSRKALEIFLARVGLPPSLREQEE